MSGREPEAGTNGRPIGQSPVVGLSVDGQPEQPEGDLALNQPGQAVRHRAKMFRQGAPVKTVIARILGKQTEERQWRVGADGEQEVAARLRRLGGGWLVLHGVPVGRHDSDIDHVVIGPPGVFTLNTKNHRRSKVWVAGHGFLVNGQKVPYLRNSKFEGKRASALLSAACGFDVAVEPIIVVRAASLKIQAEPIGAHVVGRKSIATWLTRRPAVLSPVRVDEIFEGACRASTWRPGP